MAARREPLALVGVRKSRTIPQLGDSDSVRFSDGEYIEGMTLTQHLNQMKLSAFVAIAAVIGGTYFIPVPAQAESCPSGTSYHKIKRGLFLARKTVAEGCFTPYEAAQLNMQADSNENKRRSNVMRNINANKQRQCFGNASTYGNTTYGNATCY